MVIRMTLRALLGGARTVRVDDASAHFPRAADGAPDAERRRKAFSRS